MNHSNQDRRASAEKGEGRPLNKENTRPSNTHSTPSGTRVSQGLAGRKIIDLEHLEMLDF